MNFERDIDPKASLGIGKYGDMLKDLQEFSFRQIGTRYILIEHSPAVKKNKLSYIKIIIYADTEEKRLKRWHYNNCHGFDSSFRFGTRRILDNYGYFQVNANLKFKSRWFKRKAKIIRNISYDKLDYKEYGF